MGNDKEYIFRKDFWGNWKLVEHKPNNAIGWAIVLGIILFVFCIVVLTSPLWIALLGFTMIESKRYYAGIGSVLASLYLLLDFQKQWLTGYFLFGYNDSTGKFNDGLLGNDYVNCFYGINGVGLLIGLIFIYQSYTLNQDKKTSISDNESKGEWDNSTEKESSNTIEYKEEQNKLTRNQIIVCVIVFLMFIGSIIWVNTETPKKEEIATNKRTEERQNEPRQDDRVAGNNTYVREEYTQSVTSENNNDTDEVVQSTTSEDYNTNAEEDNNSFNTINPSHEDVSAKLPIEGLVAYFPFNGNAVDESINNENNGQINVVGATLTTDRFGEQNSAYYFNGKNNYISIKALYLHNFSISCWINIKQVNPSNLNAIISNIGGDEPYKGYKGFEFRVEPNNTLMLVTGNVRTWVSPVTYNKLADNTWYHVVATSDDDLSSISIYINSALITSYRLTNFTDNLDNILLGTRNPKVWNGGWYNGKLDDIRIYNRAINQEEITALFNEK
jgi:hypothetical protein